MFDLRTIVAMNAAAAEKFSEAEDDESLPEPMDGFEYAEMMMERHHSE